MSSFVCSHCQRIVEWGAHSKIGRRDSCTHCGSDLHVCKNCKFFDPTAHRECRESISERVNDKEKANFCDLFEPNPSIPSAANLNTKSRDNLLSAAEALFKKKN